MPSIMRSISFEEALYIELTTWAKENGITNFSLVVNHFVKQGINFEAEIERWKKIANKYKEDLHALQKNFTNTSSNIK